MLELDMTIMTPVPVFETSGHVARFADWMVKDTKTRCPPRRSPRQECSRGKARLRSRGPWIRWTTPQGGRQEGEEGQERRGPVAGRRGDRIPTYSDAGAFPCSISSLSRLLRLSQLDSFTGSELAELCWKHDIRNPDTDNEVGEPQQFNLMFASSIGPAGQRPG